MIVLTLCIAALLFIAVTAVVVGLSIARAHRGRTVGAGDARAALFSAGTPLGGKHGH